MVDLSHWMFGSLFSLRHGKSSALASPYYWMVTLRGLRLSDQLPLLFMGFALPILQYLGWLVAC
jgi:hypothetical protein